jgi:hypothetical protein
MYSISVRLALRLPSPTSPRPPPSVFLPWTFRSLLPPFPFSPSPSPPTVDQHGPTSFRRAMATPLCTLVAEPSPGSLPLSSPLSRRFSLVRLPGRQRTRCAGAGGKDRRSAAEQESRFVLPSSSSQPFAFERLLTLPSHSQLLLFSRSSCWLYRSLASRNLPSRDLPQHPSPRCQSPKSSSLHLQLSSRPSFRRSSCS